MFNNILDKTGKYKEKKGLEISSPDYIGGQNSSIIEFSPPYIVDSLLEFRKWKNRWVCEKFSVNREMKGLL